MPTTARGNSSTFAHRIYISGRQALRNFLAEKGYLVRRMDDLTVLADRFGSDKGTKSAAHGYTRIYNKLFEHQRNSVITLVEIGLGRPDTPSLRMWRQYFEVGHIFGFDVGDFSNATVKGCTIIQGDMSVKDDLARLVSRVGRPIDILIDDGSHVSHHQQIALATLFSKLSPGGIYAIEDLHWRNVSLEREGAYKTRDILRRFFSTGKIESPYMSEVERSYLEENIKTLTLFDSLTLAQEDFTDALAILVKKDGQQEYTREA
jgi:hypothetical protein